MKNFYTISVLAMITIVILSSCSGSKYGSGASHNHGVSTRGFSGY